MLPSGSLQTQLVGGGEGSWRLPEWSWRNPCIHVENQALVLTWGSVPHNPRGHLWLWTEVLPGLCCHSAPRGQGSCPPPTTGHCAHTLPPHPRQTGSQSGGQNLQQLKKQSLPPPHFNTHTTTHKYTHIHTHTQPHTHTHNHTHNHAHIHTTTWT